MKKLISVLVVVLAVLFVLSVVKNAVAKGAVQNVFQAMTGLELTMKRLNIGILTTSIEVKDLRLHNPPAFKDRVMFDLPEIYVDYNLTSILKGRAHLEEVRLDLKELLIIKNERGELNLDYLKPAAAEKEPAEAKKPEETAATKEKKTPEIQIDRLVLRVGKVIYKDYSGTTPMIREFDINLNETHENITDINALVPLLVSKALINTTIASLANYDMDEFMSNFEVGGLDLSEVGLDEFSTLTTEFETKATGFLSKMKEVTGPSSESGLGETAGQAVEELKGFFGSLAGE